MPRPSFWQRTWKFVVGACGLSAQVLAAGVLDHHTALWVQAGLAIATAAGIWGVPNQPDPDSYGRHAAKTTSR